MSKPTSTISQLHPDGTPAPRDSNHNPIIEIDVDKGTCHARKEEHARKKSDRGQVIFRANRTHTLYFSNRAVFDTEEINLDEGMAKAVSIETNPTDQMETEYGLRPYPSQGKGHFLAGDPKIVVP